MRTKPVPKYRVRLPIDFGDGVVHYPGETVEPDANKAKAYRHALEPIETDADALARAIRQIRARLSLNMMKFSKLLGVTQAQISRYESGQDGPGYLPLWRLLMLAEGAEKNPFLKRLGKILPVPKENATEGLLREEFEKYGYTVPGGVGEDTKGKAGNGRKAAGESRPNLWSFALAAAQICEKEKEIDASLVEILRLWLAADDSNPAVRQLFADAATYIKAEFGSRTTLRWPWKKKDGGE
jgi:transcriptional regulator with XRE-family HTH domain